MFRVLITIEDVLNVQLRPLRSWTTGAVIIEGARRTALFVVGVPMTSAERVMKMLFWKDFEVATVRCIVELTPRAKVVDELRMVVTVFVALFIIAGRDTGCKMSKTLPARLDREALTARPMDNVLVPSLNIEGADPTLIKFVFEIRKLKEGMAVFAMVRVRTIACRALSEVVVKLPTTKLFTTDRITDGAIFDPSNTPLFTCTRIKVDVLAATLRACVNVMDRKVATVLIVALDPTLVARRVTTALRNEGVASPAKLIRFDTLIVLPGAPTTKKPILLATNLRTLTTAPTPTVKIAPMVLVNESDGAPVAAATTTLRALREKFNVTACVAVLVF